MKRTKTAVMFTTLECFCVVASIDLGIELPAREFVQASFTSSQASRSTGSGTLRPCLVIGYTLSPDSWYE